MIRRPVLAAAAALFLSACASLHPAGDVTLKIIAVNDFHGNLEAPAGDTELPDLKDPTKTVRVKVGGVARMTTMVKQRLAGAPNHIIVAAGDIVGASPLLSSLFHDEPTVEALSDMGLALSSVGNHEFDEGPVELRRMQNGGCHPVDGCQGPQPFKGAGYEYLAANVIDKATGKTLFPPYAIRSFEGIKVGFIGLTTSETPDFVTPTGVAGLTFLDEAQTINALVPQLHAQGVEAIVVLIHEGGYPAKSDPPSPLSNGCPIAGRITEIVPKLDKAVDLVVSGHTHQPYICTIDGRLVTSAWAFSRVATDITVTLSRGTHDVTGVRAENVAIRADAYAEDPAQAALVASFRKLAEPLMNRPVGRLTAAITGNANAAGESALGDLIADSFVATAARETGEPIDLGLMNDGGLRAPLVVKDGGAVAYGDLFAAEPFNNTLVAVTLTGADIAALLDQEFTRPEPYMLQVSQSMSFAWRKGPTGMGAVVPGSIVIGGKPLDPKANYRVATNSFLADGGDGFVAFNKATRRVTAGSDLAALEEWFKTRSPVAPPAGGRISLAP